MTVIAVTSSRTSPGATSLATGLVLALSADYERALLVEADAAGGVLSLRFDLDVTPSLTTFGSDARNGYSHDLVWRNSQDLRGARCIPGPVDPRLARSWVERVTPQLVQHLPTLGAPAVIDLGWVGEDGASLPLAEAADVTLIVTRPEIAEVQALLFQVRQMQAAGATVGLVTVGTTPNDPQEVAAVAGIPLVAVLPDDPKVAAALKGAKFAPNKFRRSLLWRTIGGIATSLVDPAVVSQRANEHFNDPATQLPDELPPAEMASADARLLPQAPAHPAPAVPNPAEPPVYNPDPVTHGALPPTEASTPVPVPVLPAASEHRPSFTDRHGTPMVNTPSRSGVESDTDPDAGQLMAAELAGNPDLFADTNRIVRQPSAELVMGTGERLQLDDDAATIIGRHGECDIVITDNQISRRHGRLTRTVTGWHYADLGSRNGSVLNGRPCVDAFLTPGDELYIGHARLTFQTVPAVPAANPTRQRETEIA